MPPEPVVSRHWEAPGLDQYQPPDPQAIERQRRTPRKPTTPAARWASRRFLPGGSQVQVKSADNREHQGG